MDQFDTEIIEKELSVMRYSEQFFYLINKDMQLYQLYKRNTDAQYNDFIIDDKYYAILSRQLPDIIDVSTAKKECYVTMSEFQEIVKMLIYGYTYEQQFINGYVDNYAPDIDDSINQYTNISQAINILSNINVVDIINFTCLCGINIIINIIQQYYKGSFVPIYTSKLRYKSGYISNINSHQICVTFGTGYGLYYNIRVTFIVTRGHHTKNARYL
jgi:hypothetical protein